MKFTSLRTLELSFSKELREIHPLLVFKSNTAYLLRNGALARRQGREWDESQSDRQSRREGIRLAFVRYSRRLTCLAWKFHLEGAPRKKSLSRNSSRDEKNQTKNEAKKLERSQRLHRKAHRRVNYLSCVGSH